MHTRPSQARDRSRARDLALPGLAGRYQELPASFDSRAFRKAVERVVGGAFPGATYFKTRGVWKGQGEDSLMVEVIASPVRSSCRLAFSRAERVARQIARQLGQDAVFLVVTGSDGVTRQELVEKNKAA